MKINCSNSWEVLHSITYTSMVRNNTFLIWILTLSSEYCSVYSNGYDTSTASARFNTATTACTKASTLVVNVIKQWNFKINLKYLNMYTIHFNYVLLYKTAVLSKRNGVILLVFSIIVCKQQYVGLRPASPILTLLHVLTT